MQDQTISELLQAKAHHEHKTAMHKGRYLHHARMVKLVQLKLDKMANTGTRQRKAVLNENT
jgi:hypothetical protein